MCWSKAQSCETSGHICKYITFTEANIKLVSFPHIDAMVIIAHIDKWDTTRVLVDNGS
jgi:hypothetical protein